MKCNERNSIVPVIDLGTKPNRQGGPPAAGRRTKLWPVATLLLLGCGMPVLRAATLVHDFYLPMPEAQLRQTMTSLETGISTNLDCTFSVVVTGGGTVIYYDQWEDGYEINLAAPVQSSTQVWGDGNNLNGIPPGFANDPAGLAIGTALTLRNLVPLPRNPSNLLFDGRDRISATKALVVSRMAWPVSPGSVLADAVQIPATIDWGTNYVSPIGQDLTNAMFQYVALFVMAGQDNTSVTIDADGAGPTAPLNVVLNRGESYFANGGIKKGASVVANKPVQAELVVGKIGARYASDWFTLHPVESWGSSYATPVPTPNSGNNTYVFLYNPGTNALTINYTTRIGSGSFAVSSNGVYAYVMPQSSGARFTSTNGGRFFALCTVAARPGNEAPYDWGFTLLPSDDLTTEAVVGLGLGSADGTVNGSPVWVAPLAAARLYVDYDGDRAGALTDPNGNKYDVAYDLAALQSQRIYDPDKDQTGTRVYTIDGTLFSTAWGEDADVAAAGNPYIDAGTTVLPFPVPVLRKSAAIVMDTNAPGLSIGDTLEYTVELDNRGLLPLGNTVLVDVPATNVAYVANSTTLDGNAIPDSVSGTAFPLDAPGYTIPIILRGGTSIFKYQMNVLAAGVISNYVSAVGYGIAAQTALAPPPSGGTSQCALNFTDAGGTTVGSYAVNSLVYVSLADADQNTSSSTTQSFAVVVTNVTRGDFEVVTLTETGVNTGIFRNAGGLTASVSLGIISQDGTLNAVAGDLLSVTRTDPFYGDTCNTTAVIQTPTLTKVLYLSGTNSSSQVLDRINPAAAPVDNTTAQTVSIGNLAGAVVLARTNTASGTGNSMSITNVTVTSASDRMLLVAVGFNPPGANGVTGITYSGQALTLVRSWRDGANAGNAVRAELWRLMNPPVGTNNVALTFTGNPTDITAGAMVFNGVDQTTPFSRTNSADGNGTSASITIASATNEQVFSILASRDGTAATATGAGQVRLWSLRNGAVLTTGNRTPGASNVTNSWTITAGAQWAAIGVSIKPAAGASGGTNVVTFPQTPAFCSAFTMPSGGAVTITNYITVTSGSMITNPAITATLRYGSTNFLTLSNPTYTSANSNLVWSGVLSSNTTIPAGQAISFVLSNNQSGVGYVVDFDSAAKPSRITLPASTVIHVNTLGVYDAPYPGGNLVASPISGAILYIRANVSDPFGSYDITSLGLGIDGPGVNDDLTLSLTDSSLVASDSCSKTYEYAWHTGVTPGTYNVAVTANEGSEGITDVAATSVNLTFLDLGTPSTTQFTSGNNGTATNAFPVNSSVCVRVSDTDQNLSSTNVNTITAIITSSSGDSETITLTETGTNSGVFTACMNSSTNSGAATNNGTLLAPAGSVLAVTYTDSSDPTDETSATATVLTPPGVPGLTMNKTLLAPTDGQAGVGETVTYNLQVVNSGSTTLTNLLLTDNFPSAKLSFQSASLAPTSTNATTLTWANLGNFTPGQSTNLTVSFITIATAAPAVNSATVRSTGVITNTGSVGVTITHAALTITKTVLSPTNSLVNIGSNVTFRIVVQNTGDTAIPTLPLEDTYSSSCYSNVSATIPPDGSGAGSLLWNDITGAGSLATNASITIDVVMLVTGGCDPANNTAHADYAVDVNGDPVPVATSTAGVTTGAGRITGYVYNDADQSGTLTGGDTGLDSVNVELYSDPNGDGDPSDGTLLRLATTDLSGAYELLNLVTGAYVVVENDLPGYASTFPLNNRLPLVLTALTTNANNNFFDYLVIPTNYATITGTVWADTNANGVVDGGDSGLANVAIELVQDVNANGFADLGETIAASTTTDTSGNYAFAGVIPGNYVVRETDFYGWISTTDSRPPNDNQIPLVVGSGATTNGNDFLDFFTGNNPGNDAPVANNDNYSTSEDAPLNVSAPGILGNDTDVDGDTLHTLLVSTTTHGALALSTNGSFLYTPNSNYFGGDSFTYRANDGTTNSGIATVNLTINPVNDAPIANNQLVVTPEDVSTNLVLTGSDVENTVTFALLTNPAHGALSGFNATSGTVTYSPSTNYSGPDSFTFTVSDGSLFATGTVSITVTPVNDPPVANNQIVVTPEDVSTNLVLVGSDLDSSVTYALLTTPAQGVLSGFNPTSGAVTYSPATNYHGPDSFQFIVTDGSLTATGSISITVTPANDAPVAVNDPTNTTKNVPVSVPVLVNDTDADGDSLTIIAVNPTNGNAIISGTNVVFTPATNFTGTATIGYTIIDGNGGTNSALITVSVANMTPVANNDTFTTLEDVALTIPAAGILTNDVDGDGDLLSASLVANVTHGSLNLNANGSFSYTPGTNYNGSDSFTYRAADGSATSAVATVTINITPVNDAPFAINDSTNTLEDASVTISVLVNDSDPEGTPLTITGTSTTNGTAVVSGTNVVFTPSTNFNGTVVFSYTISDGTNNASANVTVTVAAMNDTPTANNDAYTTFKNVAINLPAAGVLTNDTDAENDNLSAFLVANVTHGTLSLNANGGFLYTPASNYVGSDVFTYRAYDAGATSTVATVTITMLATNLAPAANNDSFTTLEDTTLNIPVAGILTNDVDVDGDAMTALLAANVTHGSLTLNANGGFSYTPATNYNGSDSFTYRATDGSLTSSVATVTINITPVNDAPIAVNDSTNMLEDASVTINVLANDSDPEGTPLTITGTSTTNGVIANAGTNVVFTPSTNFNGTVVFDYTISDGTNTATANVTVTVTAVNDAPVANSDSFSTLKNVAINVPAAGVLTNDTDVENDSLSALLVANVTHGTLTLNANGSFLYTPVSNYTGADAFTYRAYDAGATSASATVSLTILATNTPPVANNDSFTTLEDVPLTIPAAGILTNDVDADGDALTALLVSTTTHGALALNPNGSFTYAPATNYNGSDSFTYRARDGQATGNVATVTINLAPVNDAPIAVNDSTNTVEDVSIAIRVLVNDSDPEGTALTITGTSTTNGTAVVSGTNVVFTPSTNFNGTAVFSYTISDGTNTATANVTVVVGAVNDAPVASNDAYSTFKNLTLTIPAAGVLTNDTDVEGNALSALLVANVTHGTLNLNGNGGFLYTPASNYVGNDVFTYRAYDSGATGNLATVTITMLATNTPPVANNNSYTTLEDSTLTIPAAGILTNDLDVDGDALSAVLVANVTHGSLNLNANGSFSYTPATNFNGSDSFTYRASDGSATSAVATVSLTITPVADAPRADDQWVFTPEDVSTNLVLTGSDVDSAITFAILSGPTHGSLAGFNATNGAVTYAPVTNYHGPDSFTFTVSDGSLTATGTVTISVSPVNDPPVARNDIFATLELTPLVVSAPGVLTNDTDVDGDALSAILVTGPVDGTLSLNTNGGFTYTPGPSFAGADSFTYRAFDGQATGNLATVTIVVTPVNDAPETVADSYSTPEDTLLTVNVPGVLLNDTDIDNDPLVALLASLPTHGTLSFNTNGSFTYQPATNYTGPDSFTYQATDGQATGIVATVTINVTPVNDPPFANNQSVVTPEDVSTNLVLTGSDVDNALTFAILSNPAHGTLSGFNATSGAVTYVPNTNYNGPDSFSFTVNDGSLTATGTVTITVTPVNDPPFANNQSVITPEDVSTNLVLTGSDVDNAIAFAILVNPTHGTLSGFNATSGAVNYSPGTNYSGPDSFTFTVSGGSLTATGLVSITVTPVNDAPIAVNDSTNTLEDVSVTINALANDSDPEGTVLTITGTSTTNGVILNTGTNLVFTPALNFNGTVVFSYTISDGTNTASANVTVTVNAVNDAPVANGDFHTTAKNVALTVPAPGILINDTDVENEALSAMFVSGVSHGSLSFNTNGSFIYTPDSNYTGSDLFAYRARDAAGNLSGVAEVQITVQPANYAPAAFSQSVTIRANASTNLVLQGTDPDGDPLSYNLATLPAHGSLVGLHNQFTYTPDTGYVGADSFTFSVADGALSSGIATVSITVLPAADLAVFKTGNTNGGAGTNLTFTITVTNLGPSTASNVMAFDQLPASYTFVSAAPAPLSISGGLVRWPLFNLLALASSNFSITVTPSTAGVFTNVAYTTNSTSDPDPTNNNGTSTNSRVVTFVQPLADVAVFKAGPASVFSGGSVAYTITVTNAGPSIATNTVVTDTLPAGTTLASASGSYTLSNGVVRWAGVTLAAGASTNYTLTLTAPLTGSLTNVASASSSTADPNPLNNNGSSGNSRATTTVTPMADVAVGKSGPSGVTAGASFAYTISVTNLGPVAAANVIVRDLLPTNLVFVSATGGGVLVSNVVTWPTIASLANGAKTNFTLTVLAPASGSFTNIAFSVSDTVDPDPSNNDGSSGSSRVTSAVVTATFGVLQGTNWLNPQTGLYEQRVTVTNRSATTVAAFRLLVGNINGTNGVPRTNVTLVNATGTNVDSRPYVQYNSALNPGSNVTLMLEFFVPDRKPFTNSLEVIATLPASAGTNATAGVAIDRAFVDSRFTPARFVLEWTSVPGKTYTIIYSDVGPTGPWLVATPTVTAPNNRVQWYDDGPPKTISAPASVNSRFYRVIANP